VDYKIDERSKRATNPLVRGFDDYTRRSVAVFNELKVHPDVQPDLIVGHSGFGSTALLKELYDCPIINYFEYYYHRQGSDLDFRPEFSPTEFGCLHSRIRNAGILLDLQNCAAGYSPTQWQRSRFPTEYQAKIETIFDGIDTDFWFRRPLAARKPRWVWGQKLPPDVKVVTYVSRGFESMRGFDIFMRVAKRLCELRSDVIFVCVGDDEIHYGPDKRFTQGKSFREHVLAQDNYDLSRFIFTGRISREELARIMSVSDLHVYLTVPFILSWSCMNALACGCTVLGSATPPVQEVIQHEENGLLVDFYDVDRFVELASKVLDEPQAFRPLGEAAVRVIEEKYSLDVCLPKMIDLYERTVAGYKKCGFPQCSPQTPSAVPNVTHVAASHRDVRNAVGYHLPSIDAKDAKFSFTLTQPEAEPTRLYQRISQISYGPPTAPAASNGRSPPRGSESRGHVDASLRDAHAKCDGLPSPSNRGSSLEVRPTAHASTAADKPTRILFAIPHAFGRDPKKPFHSFRGPASERIAAMTTCLKLLHQTFGGVQEEMALFHTASTPTNTSLEHEIDIVVCTSGPEHILGDLELPAGYFRHEPRDCEPIMLGFECHALLRDNLDCYDFFCYLEDDLLIHDPWFFAKQRFFSLRAGNDCLLQPNRYEVEHVPMWSRLSETRATPSPSRSPDSPWRGEGGGEGFHQSPARKTYIDGDLDEKLVRKYQNIDEDTELPLFALGVPIPCRRTLNPHCGGFFLNAEQMEHWSRQPHFLDLDCSFFSPIESANTFGVMRTFKIYKPAPAVANFLEIEHFGTSMVERLRQRDSGKKRKAVAV
jgi:glycosyltransferase involved in cell wall biosynthesis